MQKNMFGSKNVLLLFGWTTIIYQHMIAKASLYNCVGEIRIDLKEYLTVS